MVLETWPDASGVKKNVIVIVLAMSVQFLPYLDNGYRQVYWLGETKHEIPWRYSPFNGDEESGGRFFLVKVSAPSLEPQPHSRVQTIISGKAVDFNHGRGGEEPATPCSENRNRLNCEWMRGDYVYLAAGERELFPDDTSALLTSIVDLLDSFEVPEIPLEQN